MRKIDLVYDISTSPSLSELSDDQMVLNQVSYWIDLNRAELIRQDYNKGRSINPDIVSTLPCEEVEQVDASECPCDLSGCMLLRTVNEMPEFIETSSRNLLEFIRTPVVGSQTISIINYQRVPYINANSLTAGMPKAYLYNRRIYIISDVLIDKISVGGVLSFPEDLKNYTSCDGSACWTPEDNYPCSNYMLNTIKKMVIDLSLRNLTHLTDKINDANSNQQQDINK